MIFYRLISTLPFPVLYACAWLTYLFFYHLVRSRRAVVRDNLSRAFTEKSEAEIGSLAKTFYYRLSQVAFEIIKARRMSKADFLKRARIVNPELLHRYSNDFRDSVIVLTIHQGNWEWMLHGATAAFDIPIDTVYKPQHNKTVDALIYDTRSRFGSRPLPKQESTRDILRRRREFRVFVMVADQSPTRSERGLWTEFMNQEAAFYLGTEIIAKATKFPVIFAQCRRRRTGFYEIEFHELAKPPYAKNGHEITDRYVQLAEHAIRAETGS